MSLREASAGVADEGVELPVADRWVQRRVTLIWCLLFLDVLPFHSGPGILLPIGKIGGQAVTGGALAGALLLALSLNRPRQIRPTVILTIFTLIAGIALGVSVLGAAGFGSIVRAVRLFGFLAALWLTTPWWGRRDLLLVRAHLRALLIVCGTVIAGLLIKPNTALSGAGGHRLVGIIWPIPAPQVAEYAAIAVGLAIILWLSGQMAKRRAFTIAIIGSAIVLATQTRTAVLALVVGLAGGALSLFVTRVRVRRTLAITLVVVPILALLLFPVASAWFNRNQSGAQRAGLTGRKQVWDALLAAPRPEFNRWFGNGLSDKSFGGLAIDSSWLAVYQDSGLVGDAAVAAIVGILLIAPFFRRPGAARAMAVFLVVYCAVASYTEVGLGDASPYMLTLVVAASLVAPGRQRALPDPGATSRVVA